MTKEEQDILRQFRRGLISALAFAIVGIFGDAIMTRIEFERMREAMRSKADGEDVRIVETQVEALTNQTDRLEDRFDRVIQETSSE